MAWVLNFVGTALAVYAVVVLAAWLGQRHLMYVPDTRRVPPSSLGLTGVTETELVAPDGARIVTWRAEATEGRPTILYFHGNAGNLAGRAHRFARYQHQGFGLLMMSWRGYSGGTGRPSEAANVADANLAYDTLVASGVPPASIVLYGESLGSGVALQLAARRMVGAVVLDAPYTSIVDVALLSYPYLPVRPLIWDRYESLKYVAEIDAPLLVLHGERDSIVPARMGKAVHAAAREPKRLVLFPDGGHVDLDQYGAADIVGNWTMEVIARAHVRRQP